MGLKFLFHIKYGTINDSAYINLTAAILRYESSRADAMGAAELITS
jgi:hypothetical protein